MRGRIEAMVTDQFRRDNIAKQNLNKNERQQARPGTEFTVLQEWQIRVEAISKVSKVN